jgi:ATP-dependent DNA helicase RecQ
MSSTPADILRQYWGHETFMPLQEEAISCVLNGRDSVVVLPTGGGKSICFQVPALSLPGLAVVVSPLIALMKDQVDGLQVCGFPAACINSTLTLAEKREVAAAIRSGRLRLLYISPEKLVQRRTIDFLRESGLSFIAVDEAHCISQWGHDFRPEYRKLGILQEAFPGIGIHAYTATATGEVRQDIAAQLGLRGPEFLVGSFDRPNLIYRVVRRTANHMDQLDAVLQRHPGESGIIYCLSRREVERAAAALADAGHRALPYHAGMADQDRRRNQEAFINADAGIMVATVAFGMGIDKSNIRFVIHSGMPKSLESYQQESGRAGRDGLPAECILFHSGTDFQRWQRTTRENGHAGTEGAVHSLDAMVSYSHGVACRHRDLAAYFGQDLPEGSCVGCDICLGELRPVADSPAIAGKILSGVAKQGERFGADYTALVLKGSNDRRIRANRHDRLSTWGILRNEDTGTIREWIDQLVGQGFLERHGEYNLIRVTPKGKRLLQGEGTPTLLVHVRESVPAHTEADGLSGAERRLFEELRRLRRNKATEREVPAYVIFSDATLYDMTRRRPSSLQAFSRVKGVGQTKLAEYGEDFTECIRQFCPAAGLDLDCPAGAPPAPGQRRQSSHPAGGVASAAFKYFREGMPVGEVASRVGRAVSTTLGYLAAYIRAEGLTDPAPWVNPGTVRRVEEAATKAGMDGLKPIFEELNGSVPYDDIRVVVECLRNRIPQGDDPAAV